MLWRTADERRRPAIEAARVAYFDAARRVWSVDTATAAVAGEIAALIANLPTPPKRAHGFAESRPERLARWRFDGIIAATGLVTRMTIVHNNATDFEAIRNAIGSNLERFSSLGPLKLIRCSAISRVSQQL
jgi:predicted nucleic acid-binding protein